MGMPLTFFKVCATSFGDICHAVGQEATEKFLVCEALLLSALSKSLAKFFICEFLISEWQLSFAFVNVKSLDF
jgi:hypothetical protein